MCVGLTCTLPELTSSKAAYMYSTTIMLDRRTKVTGNPGVLWTEFERGNL